MIVSLMSDALLHAIALDSALSFDRCEESFLAMNFADCIFGLDATVYTRMHNWLSTGRLLLCLSHTEQPPPSEIFSCLNGVAVLLPPTLCFPSLLHCAPLAYICMYIYTAMQYPIPECVRDRESSPWKLRNAELRTAGYVALHEGVVLHESASEHCRRRQLSFTTSSKVFVASSSCFPPYDLPILGGTFSLGEKARADLPVNNIPRGIPGY
jgi:hypothetical protein